MKENTDRPIATLHHLLDYDVRKFSSAEVQLKNILPAWIHKAGSLKLKNILRRYLDFIIRHELLLEKFIDAEGIISLSTRNRVMNALIDETEEKLNDCADAEVKDACLLSCVQEINHYKISTYGTAAAFARALDMEKQALAFHEAEVNEKQIDDRLSQLAAFEINAKARTPITLPGVN